MTTVSPQNHTPVPPGFDREVRELVVETAPRVFAVVLEAVDGDGEWDACVAAWGMAYPDGHVHLVGEDGLLVLRLESVERAVVWATRLGAGSSARVVWPVMAAA
ncbi:hypothetical protein PJ985_10410 [Streptomyces sp. ACA25]|uniref:hypothetical protein n=1 Tax=Streptomyces sp. ACA25 TaxID=3022596 RepID=UPI0023076805|nr:hypothetical protein [Streptomyces sp. ACA25]MDB1087978.1 hypothetical protein [Streptomyces sp. ACA25]